MCRYQAVTIANVYAGQMPCIVGVMDKVRGSRVSFADLGQASTKQGAC